MLHIENHLFATSLDEAYALYTKSSGNVVLGGCGYLRLTKRKIETAIDLSRLELDYIREHGEKVHIGAMTSLRTLETNALTTELWSGVLPKAVSDIVGVQLRNCVTLGGSVAGRYAFSDPITALLALDAEVHLYNQGTLTLENYLSTKIAKDIIEKIVVENSGQSATFSSVRKSATDYAILNVAVSKKSDSCRIVVGSRPGRAQLAVKASRFLEDHGWESKNIHQAAVMTGEELHFGDNPRASRRYREAICPVLVERALQEVADAA